jgi:hypothetical protein
VLPGRAATEILPSQENLGPRVAWLIEYEVRVELAPTVIVAGFTRLQVPPVVEQIGTKPAALDRLQVLLGDDRIRVDIGAIQRCHQAIDSGEGVHIFSSLSTDAPGSA